VSLLVLHVLRRKDREKEKGGKKPLYERGKKEKEGKKRKRSSPPPFPVFSLNMNRRAD